MPLDPVGENPDTLTDPSVLYRTEAMNDALALNPLHANVNWTWPRVADANHSSVIVALEAAFGKRSVGEASPRVATCGSVWWATLDSNQ